MNKKLIIVSMLVFAIMFIGALALINTSTLSSIRNSNSDFMGSINVSKYEVYIGKTLTGEDVANIINTNNNGCFHIYEQSGSTISGLGNFGDLGSTSSASSGNNVKFEVKYAAGTTGTWYGKTTSSYTQFNKVLKKELLKLNFECGEIRTVNNDEICGLVFRKV